MAGLGGVGLPSLSEIQAWDVAHLEGAATDWKATAERWESSFTSIHRVTVSPGGTVWEGAAAEAAQERAFADLVQVRGLPDVLHESSAIARRGAETLDAAKRSVLDAVEEASDAGHVVGEDLDHPWDPYTDQPAHGPFEPVQPGPTQFDPKTGTVQGGGGPIGGKGPPQPSAPTGRRGSPMDVPRGTNAPAVIDGRSFSGHALDEMQSDGIPASVVNASCPEFKCRPRTPH